MRVKNATATNVGFRFVVLMTVLIAISVFERPKSVVIMEPLWENGIESDPTLCGDPLEKKQSRERDQVPKSPQTSKEISRRPSFKNVYVYC